MASLTFSTLDDPLATNFTTLDGINTAGQIVGWYKDSSGAQHGLLYSNGTYTTLSDPLGTNGTAGQGINDGGQIAGYYYDSSGVEHGFLYSGGTYTTITDPFAGAQGTDANNINNAGQVVGRIL